MQIDFTRPNQINEEEPEAQAPVASVNFTAQPARVKLSEADLSSPAVFPDIRDYMVRRFGVDYEDATPEKTVRGFLDWQRGLEVGNTTDVAREALFIRRADNATKQSVARAYNAFESLEGIFAEDSNTLQGLGDYVWGVLSDPITYVGLGVGKLVATTGSRAAAIGLRQAAKKAAQEAMTGVVGIQARKEAGRAAMQQTLRTGLRNQSLRRAGTLGAVEGAVAGSQAYGSEAIRVMGGSKEEVSYGNVILGAALGAGLTTLGSIAADRILSPTKAGELVTALNRKPPKSQVATFQKEAVEDIIRTLAERTDWQEAVSQGRAILGADGTLPSDLLKAILLGNKETGTRGVTDFMVTSGIDFTAPRFSYQVVDFLKTLPDATKAQMDTLFEQTTAGAIRSVDEFADMFARTMNKTGVDAQITGEAAKQFTRGRMSQKTLSSILGNEELPAAKLDEVLGGSWDSYFRNVWKRMLVSALPTTAVNILGSGVYVAGQTAQDLLLMPRMMFKQGGYQAQKRIIADRFKYLFSPTANRETFEAMLRIRPDALESLKDVTNMGVRDPKSLNEVYEAFNITSKTGQAVVKGAESVVDFAQAISFVKTQDMFFKTFGLMDNLNRELLKRHGRSLDDIILSGDFRKLVSEDDLGKATHETLKMTFSADYTRRNRAYNETNRYISQLAEGVEFISRSPLGFVFPFGRFVNNIVATTWQYSPVSWVPEVLKNVGAKKSLSNVNQDVIAKSMVGMGAFLTSVEMANERLDSTGDPWHIVRDGATRIDIRNVYPLSAIMLFGDVAARLQRGETLPQDLLRDIGDQIAIGQAARDLNVVDVVEGIFTGIFGGAEDIVAGRDVSSNSLVKGAGGVLGEILGGLTRPLVSIDDFVGYYTDDLQTYDRRQIDVNNAFLDSFAAGATRYSSRILNGINQMILGGEPPSDFEFQRDATREGRKQVNDIVGKNISGLQAQGARTHTEKMFDMAGIPYWTANWRSRHPEFNRLGNEIIAPLLNEYARHAVRDERFINMNASERRVFIQQRLQQINKEVEARIKAGPNPTHIEWHIERSLLNSRENPRTRDRYNMALNRLGILESDPLRMTMTEKFQLNEYLEALQDYYQ